MTRHHPSESRGVAYQDPLVCITRQTSVLGAAVAHHAHGEASPGRYLAPFLEQPQLVAA
jgi:hypothetical protein